MRRSSGPVTTEVKRIQDRMIQRDARKNGLESIGRKSHRKERTSKGAGSRVWDLQSQLQSECGRAISIRSTKDTVLDKVTEIHQNNTSVRIV